MAWLPLTNSVTFKTRLQKQNRFTVPKLLRWKYKMEPTEVLKVTVHVIGSMCVSESYVTKMLKEGRIIIPKFTIALLHQDAGIEIQAIEVTLEPT